VTALAPVLVVVVVVELLLDELEVVVLLLDELLDELELLELDDEQAWTGVQSDATVGFHPACDVFAWRHLNSLPV
jgi:hypothetical protein